MKHSQGLAHPALKIDMLPIAIVDDGEAQIGPKHLFSKSNHTNIIAHNVCQNWILSVTGENFKYLRFIEIDYFCILYPTLHS